MYPQKCFPDNSKKAALIWIQIRNPAEDKLKLIWAACRIKNLEWAAFDYNFSLEQGVLSSDINMDGIRIDSS